MDSPIKRPGKIFKDKEPFDDDFVPEQLFEREEEMQRYGNALQDIVEGFGPNNVFVYGEPGTGKTVATHKMIEFIQEDIEKYDVDVDLSIIGPINCAKHDTLYQVLTNLVNDYRPITVEIENEEGEIETERREPISDTGYSCSQLYNMLYNDLEAMGGDILIILDEIDEIRPDDRDGLLYDLPRARAMSDNPLDDARLGVIGISNNFKFVESLAPDVKSTLGEWEILFPPYDANELRTILNYYADLAFKDGVLDDDVVPLVAAFAAQDKGDARQALDILEAAGNLARREGDSEVTEDHVRRGRNIAYKNEVAEIVREKMTTQKQAILLATTLTVIDPKTRAKSKTIYERYTEIAEELDIHVTTQRNVQDHLGSLDMMGWLEATEINRGRQAGRSYIYNLTEPPRTIIDAMGDINRIQDVIPNGTEQLLKKYEDSTTVNPEGDTRLTHYYD